MLIADFKSILSFLCKNPVKTIKFSEFGITVVAIPGNTDTETTVIPYQITWDLSCLPWDYPCCDSWLSLRLQPLLSCFDYNLRYRSERRFLNGVRNRSRWFGWVAEQIRKSWRSVWINAGWTKKQLQIRLCYFKFVAFVAYKLQIWFW